MPQSKGHRPAGGLRAHSRSSSTGSSRVGLNTLQFTQREPTQSSHQKGKKPVHSITEIHPTRTASPAPRGGHLNGYHRALSKEHLAAFQPKRPLTPTRKRQSGTKTEFAIARSDDTDDEDEWISSESGPATPAHHSDSENAVAKKEPPKVVMTNEHVEIATPRANQVAPMRADIAPALPHVEESQESPPSPHTIDTSALKPPSISPVRQVRSEAPSPTRDRHSSNKRHSLQREASLYSDRVSEMPRHPLIRGQSYHGPLKPPPLAPLTVNSEAVTAQISTSPPTMRSRKPGSPTSLLSPNSIRSPVMSHFTPSTRRTSISSSQSVATLPALSSTFKSNTVRSAKDRFRTISSTSSAALFSLNALPALSRPGTPPLVMYFPPDTISDSARTPHPLLPEIYLASHLSVVNTRNPLRESYDRVLRSKGTR